MVATAEPFHYLTQPRRWDEMRRRGKKEIRESAFVRAKEKREEERVTINQSMDASVRHYGSMRLLGAAAAKGSRSCGRICSSSSSLLLRFSEQPLKKSSGGSGSCAVAAVTPIRCISLSSTTRAATIPLAETEENIAVSQIQTDESKTARVRFVLQKACRFGDKFLIVGDDPIFGLWDPSNAIPLNWSEGHLWKAEFDITVRKSIQFKLILQKASGEIYWQPGPDRIFQAWETEKTIVISEDWESAESQKITEEDPSAEAVISLEENAISDPNVAAKLPEEDKIPEGLDLEEQIKDNEGDRLLVAALNSVPVSTFADALLVSDVVNECNSSQLYLQQVETETSERNMISEDIALPAIEKPININSAAPEDRSSRNDTLLEKPNNNILNATAGCHQEESGCESSAADVLRNDFAWGFKALQKLFFNMGFSTDPSN